MIVLKNKGLIEVDLITTMGMHVKETDSYLGRFGTGLKYAIAVFLREGVDFDLYIGKNKYEFYTEKKTVRGKEFEICFMQGKYDSIPLGFTTEFGKDWETWQAYRELFTNSVLDEVSGEVHHGDGGPGPEEGHTTFIISGAIETENVFIREMNLEKLYSNSSIDIYRGESPYIYYQGVRAKTLNKPSMYTYNIKEFCALTEDRQIAYDFRVSEIISTAITSMEQQSLIRPVLNAEDRYYESTMSYDDAGNPSDHFIEAYMESPTKTRNYSSQAFMKKHIKSDPGPTETKDRFFGELRSLVEDYECSINIFDVGDGGSLNIVITGELFRN